MYKASKLEKYSIKDNLKKKSRSFPVFLVRNFFPKKKKLRKEANSKQEFFF